MRTQNIRRIYIERFDARITSETQIEAECVSYRVLEDGVVIFEHAINIRKDRDGKRRMAAAREQECYARFKMAVAAS